jgi:EmrB/QacA subfamily drug resistance transporter
VTEVSWHWLFLVNVPIGLLALVPGVLLLPDLPHGPAGRFDVVGFLTGSTGLAALVLGLSEANAWGWTSPATLACTIGGAALLIAFTRHELRTPQPLLDMRMFRSRTFSMAFGITFLVVAAQYARLVFVPLNLEGLRGYTALDVGLMLAPAGFATAVAMTIGGRLADRTGPRLPLVIGTSVMLVALVALANIGLTTPLWLISVLLVFQGFGMGLHAAPATVAAMDTLPSELLGQGSAMRSLTSQVAGALSVATLSAVLSVATPTGASPAQAQDAYNVVFYVASAGMVGALVLALRIRPGRAEQRSPELIDDEHEGELVAVPD